jgi:hypothetical protein
MTKYQREQVEKFLISAQSKLVSEVTGELHHGDCHGVDVEAAIIAKKLGYRIVSHPPIKEDLQAFYQSHEYREPLSYFARNRNIVNETDYLLVVPYQMEWQSNGGTWYTHDYAKKVGKPIIMFWPEAKDG